MKDYIVTVDEIIRTEYRVSAKDEEEARNVIENRERSYEIISENYHDMDRIVEVEEDK